MKTIRTRVAAEELREGNRCFLKGHDAQAAHHFRAAAALLEGKERDFS